MSAHCHHDHHAAIPPVHDMARYRRVLWAALLVNAAMFLVEIGAGLGALAGRVWRIGLMGQSSCTANIVLFLAALESVMRG